jgi:hypothetical protein
MQARFKPMRVSEPGSGEAFPIARSNAAEHLG